MKTYPLTGFIAFFMIFIFMVGCSGVPDEVEVCYDIDNDLKCDDNDERIDKNNYLIIDGQKTRVYIRNAEDLTN